MEFTEAQRKFAALIGMPDQHDALRFARNLSEMNQAGTSDYLDVAKLLLWVALERALPLLVIAATRKAA